MCPDAGFLASPRINAFLIGLFQFPRVHPQFATPKVCCPCWAADIVQELIKNYLGALGFRRMLRLFGSLLGDPAGMQGRIVSGRWRLYA